MHSPDIESGSGRNLRHLASWQQRSPWILPTVLAGLTAALAIAVNYATAPHAGWIRWTAVGLLILGTLAVTGVLERRRAVSHAPGGRVITSAVANSTSSDSLNVVLRQTVTRTTAEGTETEAFDFFSERLALQSLREDSVRRGIPRAEGP